jgi:hypothetical protein
MVRIIRDREAFVCHWKTLEILKAGGMVRRESAQLVSSDDITDAGWSWYSGYLDGLDAAKRGES